MVQTGISLRRYSSPPQLGLAKASWWFTVQNLQGIIVNNPIEEDPKIHMLQQPLTTEDGFLNEAAVRELNAFVRNSPETYERLADEPEWSIPFWTSDIDIIGSFAKSAIQSHGGVPPCLDLVIGYVMACLRAGPFKDDHSDADDRFRLAELSLCDINRLLWDYLRESEHFNDWNEKDKIGNNWIDLSACLHQVCIIIRNERRHLVAFDMGLDRREE